MNFRKIHRIWAWVVIFVFFAQIVSAGTLIQEQPQGNPNSSDNKVGNSQSSQSPIQSPGSIPSIHPFVGEIAVGVSLLITYGPQIIALASTIAVLAGAVSLAIHSSKESVGIIKSIGTKLQNMLKLLLGPLTVSSSMTKESVNGLSSHLLQVAKFVSNSISTPVDQVQANLSRSLSVSRELENIANRGKSISENMKSLSSKSVQELKNYSGKEDVRLFRDGAAKVFLRLENQADGVLGTFNQTLVNTRTSSEILESLQNRIGNSISASGKQASEVSLSEIGITGPEVSKQLIEARKFMVMSDKMLLQNEKSSEGLHTELISILGSIKEDLQKLAKDNGVSESTLLRASDDFKKSESTRFQFPALQQKAQNSEQESLKLSKEITFLVDDLTKMAVQTNKGVQNQPISVGSMKIRQDKQAASYSDELYNKKVEAYKHYFSVLTSDPGNSEAIKTAKEKFDESDKLYKESAEK